MPINHHEIIEEFEAHMRESGGGPGEWWVGTAKDARAPFFRQHLEKDLGDGLTYREAYTTSAADAVLDHLVKNSGLRSALEAERGSALRDSVPAPGKIVFVYRKAQAAHGVPISDQDPLHKVAA